MIFPVTARPFILVFSVLALLVGVWVFNLALQGRRTGSRMDLRPLYVLLVIAVCLIVSLVFGIFGSLG